MPQQNNLSNEDKMKARRTKAAQVKKVMQQAINKEHEDFKAQHIFPIERRSHSCMQYSNAYCQKIFSEPDMADAHIWF